MMIRLLVLYSAAVLFALAGHPQRVQQPVPAPIDLGIQNIPQETQVWCWAAVAEQVIFWSTGRRIGQCNMVSAANNMPVPYCCQPYGAPAQIVQACNRPGSLQETQDLIGFYSGRVSSIAPPTDPMTLYNQLAQGRAVIMSIRPDFRSAVGHVIVIRGMAWTPQGPVLYVNDPMLLYTQPVPYATLLQMWQAAIVVY